MTFEAETFRTDWRVALTESEQARVRNLIASAGALDGVKPVGDQVLRELSRDRARHLVATVGDEIVGYLNLVAAVEDTCSTASPIAEVVVDPESRRRGIGSALIRAGFSAGGKGTRVWSHGKLEAAQATASAMDLVVVRELLQMRRPTGDLPEASNRADVVLRTYSGPADDDELLRVNNAAFAWHPEQGGWTDADIAERRAEPWFDADGLFLAFDHTTGALLGFHWTKIHDPELGEVYVVGVDPSAQGRGLGALLTLVGLHHLADRGVETVLLYVEADNSAAVKTYERLGFDVFSADVAYTGS